MKPRERAAAVAESLASGYGDDFGRYGQMFFVGDATNQITEAIEAAVLEHDTNLGAHIQRLCTEALNGETPEDNALRIIASFWPSA
jgi:hypothetical protein